MKALSEPPSRYLYILLLLLFLLIRGTRAVDNDFSAYPQGSQPCLYDAADESKCSGDTGTELNQCLCTNQGNFIYNTAQCVAKQSPGDLDAVYETLNSNCAGTGVTLSVSKAAFMAQASAATASSSTPTATSSTSTSTTSTGTTSESTTASSTTSLSSSSSSSAPSPTNTGSSSAGLSQGAKIGIGAGMGFGVIAAILAGAFIWLYHRRRNGGPTNPAPPPSAPMDYPDAGAGAGMYGFQQQQQGDIIQSSQNAHPTGATELGAMATSSFSPWKPPTSPSGTTMTTPTIPVSATAMDYHYGAKHDDNSAGRTSPGQPLLYELGNTEYRQHAPATELYASGASPYTVELSTEQSYGQTYLPHAPGPQYHGSPGYHQQ